MKKSITLALWIIALQLIGYCMGMLTQTNLDPWYQSLTKSQLTPPDFVFGIVWTILYVILAIVGWQVFQDKKTTPLKLSYTLQLILNWAWTPLFFYLHWPGIALICLLGIVLFTTWFLILSWSQTRVLFWLMLPYWAWVSFASYLNFVIWLS